VEVEIRPEPDERKAVLAAVEVLLSMGGPVAYGSRWRAAGISENVEDGAEQGDPVIPRRSSGATHA
jgi:hypothetical protein